jgi:hypothetical protein
VASKTSGPTEKPTVLSPGYEAEIEVDCSKKNNPTYFIYFTIFIARLQTVSLFHFHDRQGHVFHPR